METHGLIPNNIDKFTHKGRHHTRRLHGKLSYIHETPKFSKDCLKYSLYPRTIPVWNLLPDCVRQPPTLTSLKQTYEAHLHWQKPGFFVVPFTLPEKPITFCFLGKKSACAKKPESHTVFLVSGVHARLLSTFDRT